MKVLLDENLPRQLKRDFYDLELYTVGDMGWNSYGNGKLLQYMLAENFEALLTGDKNMEHQQNFIKYPIPVIVFNTLFLSYMDLAPLVSEVRFILQNNPPSGIIKVPRD